MIHKFKKWLFDPEPTIPCPDVTYDTGMYIILGLLSLAGYAFFAIPSFIIAIVVFGTCVYYSKRWGTDKLNCLMASMFWLGTIVYWRKIYWKNENRVRYETIYNVMES